MGRRRALVLPLVVMAIVFAMTGCGAGSRASVTPAVPDDDTITVGSFDFDESALLAEVYSQALEARGFRVQRALQLGPREFVAPALAKGLRRPSGTNCSASAISRRWRRSSRSGDRPSVRRDPSVCAVWRMCTA